MEVEPTGTMVENDPTDPLLEQDQATGWEMYQPLRAAITSLPAPTLAKKVAYLVAIAATNYEVYNHTVPNGGNPFEIINYVYPEDLTFAGVL